MNIKRDLNDPRFATSLSLWRKAAVIRAAHVALLRAADALYGRGVTLSGGHGDHWPEPIKATSRQLVKQYQDYDILAFDAAPPRFRRQKVMALRDYAQTTPIEGE